MQLFNPHYSRFLPFFFLLVECITLDPSRNEEVDTGDAAQSVVSPLLDGSNNSIAGSEDGLEEGQGWPPDELFDTANAAPLLAIASTDQTDDACPLPPMGEYSQRRKVRRGDACTAPLQFKPEERTAPKPKPGNNDGASKTPGDRNISPHSGPSFEPTPSSWKAPRRQPTTSQKCPDPVLSNPVCAFRLPDRTNWVERQYPGITVDLPECYLCMFFQAAPATPATPFPPSPCPLPPLPLMKTFSVLSIKEGLWIMRE